MCALFKNEKVQEALEMIGENSRKLCINNDIFMFEFVISRLFKADKNGMILPFILYQQMCHKLYI